MTLESARRKAIIPSSSINTGGEACAAGKQATPMRSAALRCSYEEQCIIRQRPCREGAIEVGRLEKRSGPLPFPPNGRGRVQNALRSLSDSLAHLCAPQVMWIATHELFIWFATCLALAHPRTDSLDKHLLGHASSTAASDLTGSTLA